jgi:hypothetical protein
MKIRNKKTGEIREVSVNELNQYGLGGQNNKLVKYQKKGEVKKSYNVLTREDIPGDALTSTAKREIVAAYPHYKNMETGFLKGVAYVSPDYKSQEDRELLFRRHRPVAYPSISGAISDYFKDKSNKWFNTSMQQPFRDKEGDYEASEEAWRMTLGLPVKTKYIIPSKYRPLNETNKASKYYTLREDMYDKNLLRKKIQELNLKPGQSAGLESFAPFVNEKYMNRDDFSQVDPLQNFTIGVNKNGKMYFYDKYDFDFEPLSKVTRPYEYEIYNEFKSGGQHGGLDRWFAEKWVDIKTGKPCGRQEGEDRNYPACRPSKRISSATPKTASELSSSEKQKFKQEKTSSQRISYNHKRMEYGGENINNMNYMKSGGNVPTNPELWSRAKSAARSKYDVYPSAYANGFAAKWYKQRGGGWKKAAYGMEVMANGGVPNNPGFNALPEYVQQNIINNMSTGGQKMPPKLAYARFAAAGNLDQLDNYGYQNGGNISMYNNGGEPDGEMALGQIDAAINKLTNLRKFIQPNSNLEPWVSSKLTMVDDYANSVSDYMMYNPETKGMMELPIEEMEYGGIPMYGPGGENKPTASDSLAVMNSALAVQKYYDNLRKKGWYKEPKVTRGVGDYFNPTNLNEIEKESLSTYTDHFNKPSFYMISTKSVYPKVTENDIKKKAKQSILDIKNKKPNTYIYKDLAPTEIDEWAPPTLIDMRIKPQTITRYVIKKDNYMVPGGGYTDIMGYDPIVVKPAAMKTASDWAYMQKNYGVKPPAKVNPKPPVRQTVNTTQGKVTGVVRPNQIKGSQLVMMMDPVRTKDNLERLEMVTPTLVNPKIVTRGELLPVPSKQTVNLTNLIQPKTYPIDIYDRKGNFIRQEFMGDSEGVVDQNYIGKHHYAPRGGNSYIDTNYANGGSLIKYQDKGEVKKRKWYYPKEETTNERPYYDPPTETLYLNPNYNNEPEIVRQHELFHHLQKINGGAQRPEYYTGPLKEPNMMMNEDLQGAYWNRKTVDVNNLMDQVISKNPDFKFYPEDLFYNKVIDGLEYETSGTLENEARQYEDYIRSGGTPMFNNGGGIPERYRNMGFTKVGAKKQSTRPGKKWMVLAKKGNDYKVVHGGYKGMQDFKQHHSEQRKENFWSRMGGRNSSKATDPFSPLYWHKRFGTWEYGGQPMAIGGQNMMNPIVKKDNRNWLEYLKN